MTVAAVLAAFGAGLGGAPAGASEAPADFSFDFATTTPGTPSDARLHILYKDPENPRDPDGQSPPLTRVEIAAPPGTVLDGSAVPPCTASDVELMLLGARACPASSRVGGGYASVLTTVGPPSEIPADVTLLNYGEGIAELLEFLGGGLKLVDRAAFHGESTMVLHPPVVPGFTEREFDLRYDGTPGGAATPLITTPPECPPSGVWISRLSYTVTTGATYTVESAQRCERPAITASVRPRRVRAGRRASIRVRLRSVQAECIDGATVGLGGRHVRTDSSGRATLAIAFRRGARRMLTASKPGCAPGRARITVLPRR